MSLLPVNVEGSAIRLDRGALQRALGALAPGVPVVVMIHGFRYAPGAGRHCPHGHILSLAPRRDIARAISWPRHLRLAAPGAGLAIAFGWNARGTLWQAQARTGQTAQALAALVTLVRTLAPDRPVDLIAHSLGARVALASLPQLGAGDIGRLLLLAPADFQRHADHAMQSPAGRRAEVVSVTCRANAMFDFCMETLLSARMFTGLAHGLSKPQGNWLDLPIDDPGTERALARFGFPLRPTRARICHWQPYLRPGLFALYRALLGRDVALAPLRAALAGPPPQRRVPPRRPPLPLTGNPA